MPVVQKKDIQPLLFNTLKTIQLLESITDKTEDQIARLEELQTFRDRLIKAAGDEIRTTPQPRELNRYPGIPEGAAGNIANYTFPGEKQTKEKEPQKEVVPEDIPETITERPIATDEAQAQPRSIRQPRKFAGDTTRVTQIRPRVKDIEQREQLPLKELQNIRRKLQRAEMENVRNSQGKSGKQLEDLQRSRDEIREALNATISLERQRYEENPSNKPDDWADVSPSPLSWDELQKFEKINVNEFLDNLPEQLRFAQQEQRRFGLEQGEEKDPSRFQYVNDQIKRIVNDIKAASRNSDKLDQRIPEQNRKKEEYERQIDALKDQLRYFQSLKDIGIEKKWLSDEYDTLKQKLLDSLTPEQRKIVQEGSGDIDINKVPNKSEFIRNLREMGRELDRIGQASKDEFEYLNADPQNTVQDFRAMPLEERQDVLKDIKRQNFMRSLTEKIDDFYVKNKGKNDPETFDQIPDPATQQKWYKRLAASEAKKGAPGISGDDVYKFLFGGGEQFISKYPPELYDTMVRAARRGFGGMEQASNRLSSLAMQDPYELLYGEGAPAQRQFVTGAGQAPMVPELPQEYAFTPIQPQNQLSQALQQGLQQSPTTEIPQNPANQLINSKLANLLQGA